VQEHMYMPSFVLKELRLPMNTIPELLHTGTLILVSWLEL